MLVLEHIFQRATTMPPDSGEEEARVRSVRSPVLSSREQPARSPERVQGQATVVFMVTWLTPGTHHTGPSVALCLAASPDQGRPVGSTGVT